MGKISTELDRLSVLRAEVDDIDNEIATHIPKYLSDQRDTVSAACKDLENEIKVTAANLRTDHRHTFKGKLLQVVYTAKVSYPKAAVESKIPERYLKLVRKTADVWGIRKAAKQ